MADSNWTPQAYLDQLRPDRGWKVTLGLFATYSAEMFSIAATLLALTGRQNGRGSGASVHVIDAVEQLRNCVRIMAQAGRIAPPENLPKIAGIFDQFIVDVPFPEADHSWHPKIALVRYSSPVMADRWRLWVGSRNLTGSRDLEAGLLLDGSPARRAGAAKLPGIGDLGGQLAGRANIAGVDPSAIDKVLGELRWSAPAGVKVKQVELFPGTGDRAYAPPSGEIDRIIVISPFLCPKFVARAGTWGSPTTRRTLVSTEPAIRAVSAVKRAKIERFADLLIFDTPELFAPPELEPVGDDKADETEVEPISLHAKLTVFEQAVANRLIIGSANASDRAWSGRNAEVVATLDINNDVLAGLHDLCGRGRRIEVSANEPRTAVSQKQTRFDQCRKSVSSGWCPAVQRENDHFTLVADEPPPLLAGYSLEVMLATQSDWLKWQRAVLQCELGTVALFDQTGLVRFRLAGDGLVSEWARAVAIVPGVPDGRDLAAFGRHLGPRALAAWLRGRFQPDLNTAPDDDWDRSPVGKGRWGTSARDDERITLEEILLAWARDPAGFVRINDRFSRLLSAVIDHGDVGDPAERKRLSELASVWALAQQRLGKPR